MQSLLPPEPRVRPGVALFAVLAVVLTALSLRSAVTSVGVELGDLRAALSMSGGTAGLLTALPVICFAVFGALTPALTRRVGALRVVVGGLVADVLGLAVRAMTSASVTFLAASLVALAGIAVANITLPVLIRRYFPDRFGLMTGVFSMCVMLGVGIPAAATVPIGAATGQDWRAGLAAWAAPALLAILPWILLSRWSGRADADPAGPDDRPAGQRGAGPAAGSLRLARDPTALGLAAFFGLQSLGAYAVMGWLPAIYHDAGLPEQTSGLLLALTVALAIPLSLLLPPLAARLHHQRALVVAISTAGLAGYAGLLIAPAVLPWLWAVLLTAAQLGFPLAISLIGLRAREPSTMAQLSGFVQSTGYTLAAAGPLTIGVLRDATGAWTAPLAVLLGCMALQLLTGLAAARAGHIDRQAQPTGSAGTEGPGPKEQPG